MTKKRKAAIHSQAGRQGKTASKTSAINRNKNHTFRQRNSQIIVCACCRGFLSFGLAEWFFAEDGCAMSDNTESSNTASSQRNRILEHLQHDTLITLQARSMGIERANKYCPGGMRHQVERYRLVVAREDES